MSGQADLLRVRLDLDHAMSLVPNDRWVMGSLREVRLRVLADSSPERDRPFRRVRPLSRLARRCLHDRRPLTVSAVPAVAGAGAGSNALPATAARPTHAERADWELDWPALVYAPVGVPGRRPVGLLTVGCLADHWYRQDEIDYVAALGVTLSASP